MDPQTLSIFAVIAVVLVAGYFIVMRVFFRQSKELDKKIDYGKMKPWKDDED
jgi:low affinity Fe/Cu permease